MGRSISESQPTEVGLRVRKLRELAAIDQLSLSIAAGYSKAVVWQLENGVIANPSAELMLAIADALGTTVPYLCRGIGDAPAPDKINGAFILATERTGK